MRDPVSTSDASRPTVFVSSSRFERVNLERALPESHGVSVVYNDSGKRLTEDQLISHRPHGCVAIIAGLEPLSRRVLEQYPDLKVIARLGTGMDSVDVAAARERGVAVIGTPDATTNAVAELTVGLMIAALRGIATSDRGIRSGAWASVQGGLICGRVVGVVGFGRIGRRVAELVEAFGARVRFFDPITTFDDRRRAHTLDELLASSDIVTLHTPLNDDTRGMLSGARLAMIRDGALVVNCARGGLVDELALADSVRSGRLKAALDCFVDEPYTGPLRDLEGVVLTAHMGSLTAETRHEMESSAAHSVVSELRKHGVL